MKMVGKKEEDDGGLGVGRRTMGRRTRMRTMMKMENKEWRRWRILELCCYFLLIFSEKDEGEGAETLKFLVMEFEGGRSIHGKED